MKRKMENRIGQVYGFLVITADLGRLEYGKQGQKSRYVIAKCLNCQSTPRKYLFSNLKAGFSSSCGCVMKQKFTTHGMHGTRPYNIWKGMTQRCRYAKSSNWNDYGGRGISVCQKWSTFEGFWEDMNDGYSDDLEIDRINVNGNYGKDNCRWATGFHNSFNTRPHKTNTSKKSGVHFNLKIRKWTAYIQIDKKRKHLGSYLAREDAVDAREKAEIEQYGYTKA